MVFEPLDVNYRFVREKPDHLDKVNVEYEFLDRKNKRERDARSPFEYIRDGDFDIVWINVLVFGMGHLFYIYSFSLLGDINPLTWVFCE